MTTFVVAHGAWLGAWGWDKVADRLRRKGHAVHVPTLSGLGERSHLARFPINLTTHIDDVVNEIVWHDLSDVVLAGHSYGGFVVTGVAERVPERIAGLVYIDAFIPKDGQSFADSIGATYPGDQTPVPEIGSDEYGSRVERDRIVALCTPQPTGTFTERLAVSGAYRDIARKTYVLATGWDGFAGIAAPLRHDPTWHVEELSCGHDVPQLMPDALAELLERA